MAKKIVLSVKRSPLNSHAWLVRLSCGHELEMITSGRPTLRDIWCWKCKKGIPVVTSPR
jgi:hypothetical protein